MQNTGHGTDGGISQGAECRVRATELLAVQVKLQAAESRHVTQAANCKG